MNLARLEALLDEPCVAGALAEVEMRLSIGVRPRQCSLRTLVLGMLCCPRGRQSLPVGHPRRPLWPRGGRQGSPRGRRAAAVRSA